MYDDRRIRELDVQTAEASKKWLEEKSSDLKVGLVHSKLTKNQR